VTIRTGLVVMSFLFGFLFGPLFTLGAASMLAVAGFSRNDFAAAGWGRLLLFTMLGCGVGIALGTVAGTVLVQIITAGDAIIFMLALIGGILGALVPGTVLVGKTAKRRLAQ
jgi:MFS family permease